MVKKESHKNNWLIIAVSVVALVALVLSSVSMTKANITGEAFWDFFRKDKAEKVKAIQEQTQASETYMGLLAESYLADGKSAESLKGYSVEYDSEGNLIYEIVGEGTELVTGDKYFSSKDPNKLTSVNILPVEGVVIKPNKKESPKICTCPGGCTVVDCNVQQGMNQNNQLVDFCVGSCSGDACGICAWGSPDTTA